MKKRKPVPTIPLELVEWLESLYPDRAPDPRDSDREVWIKRGHVEVTRKLRQVYESQQEVT